MGTTFCDRCKNLSICVKTEMLNDKYLMFQLTNKKEQRKKRKRKSIDLGHMALLRWFATSRFNGPFVVTNQSAGR